jgi:hypothetical protein
MPFAELLRQLARGRNAQRHEHGRVFGAGEREGEAHR